ncbi:MULTISPECIES: hypothetical protein [unclassified Bradyrhizobium]|uniref:hypothetical protein n=1 Tax=unclassified Bradyrhizobium TaxID=2631580 RepID=UPI003D222D22
MFDFEQSECASLVNRRALGEVEEVCRGLLCGRNRDCSDAVPVIPPRKKATSIRVDDDVLDFFES